MADLLRTILPDGWPRPSGYANAIRVPAGRDLLVVAGMIGWDERGQLVSPDLVPQLEQALRNLATVLERGGSSPADLVRVTLYVTDKEAWRASRAEIGLAWRRVLGKVYPAMTLVEVKGLLEPGAVVEVEATAAVALEGPRSE